MIRVVVVDDEALVRSGFTMILDAAADIEVVATATGVEALQVITDARPDVLLLDIRMPEVDGLAVLNSVRRLPDRPVVAMLTTFDTDEYILTALQLGAAGFLLKDTEPEQLADYVRALAAGAVVLSPKASRTLLANRVAEPAEPDGEVSRIGLLSDRERSVLKLVAAGLTNAEIAARLHIGAGTVKDHLSAILSKLVVGTRVQAALAAQRAGLLDPNASGEGR